MPYRSFPKANPSWWAACVIVETERGFHQAGLAIRYCSDTLYRLGWVPLLACPAVQKARLDKPTVAPDNLTVSGCSGGSPRARVFVCCGTPFDRRKGDSPIFAAIKHFRKVTSLAPRKSGQSPVNGYQPMKQAGPWLPLILCLAWSTIPVDRVFSASTGQLALTVVDKDTGKPVACRMHLQGPKKRPFKPEKVPFWHDHFIVPGKILLKLPVGDYTFVIERGPEYLQRTGHFTINHFADDSKTVELRRFIDMAADGLVVGRSGRSPPGPRHRAADDGR